MKNGDNQQRPLPAPPWARSNFLSTRQRSNRRALLSVRPLGTRAIPFRCRRAVGHPSPHYPICLGGTRILRTIFIVGRCAKTVKHHFVPQARNCAIITGTFDSIDIATFSLAILVGKRHFDTCPSHKIIRGEGNFFFEGQAL